LGLGCGAGRTATISIAIAEIAEIRQRSELLVDLKTKTEVSLQRR